MKSLITIALIAATLPALAQSARLTKEMSSADQAKDNAISVGFESQKGKLIMPVAGQITDHFGRHPHAKVQSVLVDQNGIDIATTANAPVHAAYDGTVISIFKSGEQTIILVQHGSYFTVYTNVLNVAVKNGDHVTAGQEMGTVAADANGTPTVNFQIWHSTAKGREKLNPEEWLKG